MKYTGLNLKQIQALELDTEQMREVKKNRDAKKIRQRLNKAKAQRKEDR